MSCLVTRRQILKRLYGNIIMSHSQSGFRPDRSTADVAWAHKWMVAKTKKEDVEIKITGIDMSSAFDTIDRQTLLDILREIMERRRTENNKLPLE